MLIGLDNVIMRCFCHKLPEGKVSLFLSQNPTWVVNAIYYVEERITLDIILAWSSV